MIDKSSSSSSSGGAICTHRDLFDTTHWNLADYVHKHGSGVSSNDRRKQQQQQQQQRNLRLTTLLP
jgi:hypothetical protein